MRLDELVSLNSYYFIGLGKKIAGEGGCKKIYKTLDEKSVIIVFDNDEKLVYFPTKVSIPTYYPLIEVKPPDKISAVLMDYGFGWYFSKI